MRRQAKRIPSLEDMNLDLCWTHGECGVAADGFWSVSKALLCSRRPERLLASIHVRNNEFSINIEECGLADLELLVVERYLESLNLTSANDGRIQD